jgi:hypothetical protein
MHQLLLRAALAMLGSDEWGGGTAVMLGGMVSGSSFVGARAGLHAMAVAVAVA